MDYNCHNAAVREATSYCKCSKWPHFAQTQLRSLLRKGGSRGPGGHGGLPRPSPLGRGYPLPKPHLLGPRTPTLDQPLLLRHCSIASSTTLCWNSVHVSTSRCSKPQLDHIPVYTLLHHTQDGIIHNLGQDTSQASQNSVTTFVQLQNSFFKLKFPSFWHTSSKYGMKQQTRGLLSVENTSKIWCKNIHAFLRNCDFHVGVFYFDVPCMYGRTDKQTDVAQCVMRPRSGGCLTFVSLYSLYFAV